MDNSSMLMVLVSTVVAVTSWFALPLPWAHLLLGVGRKMAGLQPRSIYCDKLKWRYLEGGSGPVLLLLHGFGGDADNWLKVGRQLTRKFRVIAPDLPGFGYSDRPDDAAFDIDTQLLRLIRFMEMLDIKPAIVAGNSMGAWLACAYARTQPELLKGLWLLAPLGVRSAAQSPMLAAIERDKISPLRISDLVAFTSRVFKPMFGRSPWIPYPLKVHYGTMAIERSATATQDFEKVLENGAGLEDLAPLIRIPVLLQWGTADLAVDVSGAGILEQCLSNIEVRIQKNVGHLPMLEAPKESISFFFGFISKQITGLSNHQTSMQT